MLINLKNCAAKAAPQTVKIKLHERLPARINSPCLVNCQFTVRAVDNYYLMTLDVDVILTITCQRCLDLFSHHYINQTVLAICSTDERAEKMIELYESIVADHNQVDLIELVTDELHLYAPEFHALASECNRAASRFIREEHE